MNLVDFFFATQESNLFEFFSEDSAEFSRTDIRIMTPSRWRSAGMSAALPLSARGLGFTVDFDGTGEFLPDPITPSRIATGRFR